jgi:hypothetical protein
LIPTDEVVFPYALKHHLKQMMAVLMVLVHLMLRSPAQMMKEEDH